MLPSIINIETNKRIKNSYAKQILLYNEFIHLHIFNFRSFIEQFKMLCL